MYQDLRSKLELYKSGRVTKVKEPCLSGPDVHDIIGGDVCCNDEGACFVIEKRFPLSHMHGGCSLGKALEIDRISLGKLFLGNRDEMNLSDFLFLDTETTGLSGGAGTVAFLVGAGYFQDDEFVLKQFFMRDYNEEGALLVELNALLSKYKGLVTFNGKSFDWNLLCTRFTFNRLRPALRNPLHLDLLYPSRSIWKLKLDSCRLSTLEEHILSIERFDDIPGSEIPSAYFKYLDDRNATTISKVIGHNETDILSMVALLVRLNSIFENPLVEAGGEKELIEVGRIFEKASEFKAVESCYKCCSNSDNLFIRETALKKLALMYKKNKDYDKALECWEGMLAKSGLGSVYPLVELAKYYEHKRKDINKALELVEQAISLNRRINPNDALQSTGLKKRYERLKNKLG